MKEIKIELRLCMGSSCYSRGNNEVLEAIKKYIEENQLQDIVDFRGHLCKGQCKKGPNFSIGEMEYHDVSLSNIHMVLEDYFKTHKVV